jgi:hypothetical protein
VSALPGRRGAEPSEPPASRRLFYRVRVAILLLVLACVTLYAVGDYWTRHARRDWQRPLDIALILLERGPLDPVALAAFETRIPELERALEAEFRRYEGTFRPFRFRRFGPVPERVPPPSVDAAPGLLEPLRISYELFWFARRSDEAVGLEGSHDGKIYVLLSAPVSSRRALVEGLGQDGGRIAVTHIELSEDSVDFGLFVITHELFHLLGAGDRYGADGMALVPDGLGQPEQEPLSPQQTAEVMARGRVIEPGQEVPAGDLGELRVGTKTASEIGWRTALPASGDRP